MVRYIGSVKSAVTKSFPQTDFAVFMINGTFFADDEIIPIYAKLAVYAVRNAGIIEGYDNKFNPNDSLTRAEAATVLMKFLEMKQ